MGDRANVVITQDYAPGNVFLYTHWGGSDLPLTVQRALRLKLRWNDESYLARIIFEHMTGLSDLDIGLASLSGSSRWLGYGIATYPPDNEWPLLVVDCKTQIVGFCAVGDDPGFVGDPRWVASFQDFCDMKAEALIAAWKESDRNVQSFPWPDHPPSAPQGAT